MSKKANNVQHTNMSTRRIVKNLIFIGLAFMVHFTAFGGAANLQSSINAEAGLGTASLASVYAGLIFSNIALPAFVIKYLGTKWALSFSFLLYMPYIAAQLHPTFYTLIPAGLLVGLGGGPLWCAKCTYLTIISEAHNKISKIPAEAIFTRFLGIFFMIFSMNEVWGNLISSLVISSGENQAAAAAINESMIPVLCGANFLPSADAAAALQPQPPEKIQMIVGIYLACMAGAAVIVAVGVDSTKRFTSDCKESRTGMTGLQILTVTIKLLAEPYQLMLIIIYIFLGMQKGFLSGDFTASFVSCSIGPGAVGFVMMVCGASGAVGCVVTGYLAKDIIVKEAKKLEEIIGRVPMISAATVIHTAVMATLLVWRPRADLGYVLYIIAVLWGIADSLWVVQLHACCGALFKGNPEAAFSNLQLWQGVGYIIAYVVSPYLRTSAKTYFVLVTMLVGVSLYFVIEYKEHKIKIEAGKKRKELYNCRDYRELTEMPSAAICTTNDVSSSTIYVDKSYTHIDD